MISKQSIVNQIDTHLRQLSDATDWASRFGKESFPVERIARTRRELKRMRAALAGNCSAAAYGESQVGKSYLMSSLLSTPDSPFVIENCGRSYSFIDEINSSGGNNNKVETTGVITRFTLSRRGDEPSDMVRIATLAVPDIVMLLVDAYYNDIKINADNVLQFVEINHRLEALSARWRNAPEQQQVVTADEIADIIEYMQQVIGAPAAAVLGSNFEKSVSRIIASVPVSEWRTVFSLLWNDNEHITQLFDTLISAYARLDFAPEVYVPFAAVLRRNGTLLKVDWLDSVCGVAVKRDDEVTVTDVFRADGTLIASDFAKCELSALIAELTFVLPERLAADRPFLRHMDLLDFPGARSREKFKEAETQAVLPQILRRGKVAYLFNKYSRELQIGSVLFCHHNDQKSEPTIGDTINTWLEENIGRTPAERAGMLADTNGISPLFLIATKFNIDLERTKIDDPKTPETLDKHWNRFDTVLPEIIKPNKWLDEWTQGGPGLPVQPFRNIYPLRDFFWSNKNRVFEGYSDKANTPESGIYRHADYPDYMEALKRSFMSQPFVRKHFSDPQKTWDSVATPRNDGSKAILDSLDSIAGVLDNARTNKYLRRLDRLRDETLKLLEVYYDPEDMEERNKKVRLIAGDIRRSLMHSVASRPETFGQLLDSLMVKSEPLRNIAYEVIVIKTETPRDFSAVTFYRAAVGIDITQPREVNIQRLIDYTLVEDEKELRNYLHDNGYDLEDLISRHTHILSSVSNVVVKNLVEYWTEHLRASAARMKDVLPHADEVVFMLITLFRKLNIAAFMDQRISRYIDVFDESEQPNAIGDFAALTFNDFVSTVGRRYLTDDDIREIRAKAEKCRMGAHIGDFAPETRRRHRQPLLETLKNLDRSVSVINQTTIDMSVLNQLPFWNNYQKWEKAVIAGLVMSSDVSQTDPAANSSLRVILDTVRPLYQA